MDALNWPRIAIMVLAVFPASIAVAYLLWRKRQGILGSLAGGAVIFGTAIVLILKESTEMDALADACIQAGMTTCFASNPFTRYGVYAFIGLAEVIVLFLLGLRMERRIRDRDFAPEWRSWGEN
jgi:hypothetical protein